MNQSLPRENLPVLPQWRWHQRALLRLRNAFGRELEEFSQSFRVPPDHGGEDLIDTANDRVSRDVMLAEHSVHENAVAEIDAALERMARGTYGICEDTGISIEAARLRALPWTRYCLAAAAQREQKLSPPNSSKA